MIFATMMPTMDLTMRLTARRFASFQQSKPYFGEKKLISPKSGSFCRNKADFLSSLLSSSLSS